MSKHWGSPLCYSPSLRSLLTDRDCKLKTVNSFHYYVIKTWQKCMWIQQELLYFLSHRQRCLHDRIYLRYLAEDIQPFLLGLCQDFCIPFMPGEGLTSAHLKLLPKGSCRGPLPLASWPDAESQCRGAKYWNFTQKAAPTSKIYHHLCQG